MGNEKSGDTGLTGDILGAAIDVHRALGPGFLESIYEEALCIELEARMIPFQRQLAVAVRYRDRVVGEHRLDLLVKDEVIVELKAVRELDAIHFSTARSYLKALDLQVALVLNFAASPLMIRRIDRQLPLKGLQ